MHVIGEKTLRKLLYKCRGAGSSLLLKPNRIEQIVRSMSSLLSTPLTIKAGLSA